MKAKAILTLVSITALSLLAAAATRFANAEPANTIDPPDESEVELSVVDGGTTYKLFQANLYRVNSAANKWEFIEQLYDPDFLVKNYVERGGTILRKTDNGELIPVRRQLADGFETVRPLREMIGLESGWTGFTLQSPQTPSVGDYVALRNRILKGQADFLDNRVETSAEVVHSGKGALKIFCTPRVGEMVTAKASLDTELVHFVKGDDVWFSAWYYIPEGSGMPFTVMDLESSWIKQYPGIRIVINESGHAMLELKWAAKPKYRQTPGKEIPFPVGKWTHLVEHLHLSEKEDGLIELWQDGQKIVDARGQNLPLTRAIYNNLEIGISAYNDRTKPATLYVDDVVISNKPIE